MTSQKKAEAARLNGAKSKGPRTQEGKATSSQNATKLQLSLPLIFSSSEQGMYDELMELFSGLNPDQEIRTAADMAAYARVQLQRVRNASQSAMLQAAEVFGQPSTFKKSIQLAASCRRYEGRAFSKWKKAARRLSEARLKIDRTNQSAECGSTQNLVG